MTRIIKIIIDVCISLSLLLYMYDIDYYAYNTCIFTNCYYVQEYNIVCTQK